MNPTAFLIQWCTECPLRHNNSEAMIAYCYGTADRRTLYVDTRSCPEPMPPPDWCPLRRGGVLIELRKSRRR